MTEQNIKNLLKIEDWSEIREPEQLLKLMNYFHKLAPGVRTKIVSKIPALGTLTESFKGYCSNGIVEYEPSIFMLLTSHIDNIVRTVGTSDKIKGPEKKTRTSLLFNSFSEWFGLYGEVHCVIDERDFICNIAEAIEIAIENDESDDKNNLKMMMLTRERIDNLEYQEEQYMKDLDDVSAFEEFLGDEDDWDFTAGKGKDFLN